MDKFKTERLFFPRCNSGTIFKQVLAFIKKISGNTTITQVADKHTTPRGRVTEHPQQEDIRKTLKANQLKTSSSR